MFMTTDNKINDAQFEITKREIYTEGKKTKGNQSEMEIENLDGPLPVIPRPIEKQDSFWQNYKINYH